MKVIFKDVNKPPVVKEISNELHAMQELVSGGYDDSLIEPVYLPDSILVCNEEGLLLGFGTNVVIVKEGEVIESIHGPLFICGEEDDDFTDLSDGLISKYMDMLSKDFVDVTEAE